MLLNPNLVGFSEKESAETMDRIFRGLFPDIIGTPLVERGHLRESLLQISRENKGEMSTDNCNPPTKLQQSP